MSRTGVIEFHLAELAGKEDHIGLPCVSRLAGKMGDVGREWHE